MQRKSKLEWRQGTVTALSEIRSRQMTHGSKVSSSAWTSFSVLLSTFCLMSSPSSMRPGDDLCSRL